jgi:hypothetical protein
MTLHWVREDTPRWDAGKQRLFGPEELAAVGYEPPSPGSVRRWPGRPAPQGTRRRG